MDNDIASINDVIIFGAESLSEAIQRVRSHIPVADEHKFQIDQANNLTHYGNSQSEGIFVNISSNSLIKAYNKFGKENLFNLNIRKYIKNKTVDEGLPIL